MTVAFLQPSQTVESAIVEELMQWSKEVLEKPSPYFNNLPPCPYAKQAWFEGKVAILFKYENNYQTLYNTIALFDDNFDLAIIVDLGNKKNSEEFHEYLEHLNEVISQGMFIDKDVWVMGFHPDDEANDFVEDVQFDPVTDVEYAMIFVQRLSKLQVAADKLDKKGYYDIYNKEYDAKELYAQREKLYRRLKNGNETS